ncbi:MAG: SUMF1/EgtB/PvdO family nonheme iron enzyme [Alphaproteobacteria bacterium]|nr:SUMF1/EgtB/PvdO family nonheme iron enzyme [Alphaproteobacteria bacterium]
MARPPGSLPLLALWLTACAPKPGEGPVRLGTDADGDGVTAAADCDDQDATSTVRAEDADCDGVLTPHDCDDADAGRGATQQDQDCDGVPTAQDCDDADPEVGAGDCDTGAPPLPDPLISSTLGAMPLVPAGSFVMGCVPGRDDVDGIACTGTEEVPTREVVLTHAFWVMEREVDQGSWGDLGFANPSAHVSDDRPVEYLTWWEMLAGANAASEAEGLDPCYELTGCTADALGEGRTCTGVRVTAPGGHPVDCGGYRLPTEAEWEWAARGGGQHAYAGSDDGSAVAWHSGNADKRTHPGCDPARARNGHGLCDMSGNVWERVWDLHGPYPSTSTATDPQGSTTGVNRGCRGGAYSYAVSYARVATRARLPPEDAHADLGFRLVRTAFPP